MPLVGAKEAGPVVSEVVDAAANGTHLRGGDHLQKGVLLNPDCRHSPARGLAGPVKCAHERGSNARVRIEKCQLPPSRKAGIFEDAREQIGREALLEMEPAMYRALCVAVGHDQRSIAVIALNTEAILKPGVVDVERRHVGPWRED